VSGADEWRPADHDKFVDAEMAEAAWHIENATLDVSRFMQPVPVGAAIGDAEVFTPDGEPSTLSALWAERPALIIGGSLTCPPSRRLNPATSAIAEHFAGRVRVVVLYVIDAHPDGDLCPYTGTAWPHRANRAEKILIRQPRDQAERCARAREYRDLLRLQVDVVVDNMDNTAWAALGRSPNAAVLVGTDGRCRAWQDWFRPDGIEVMAAGLAD